MNDWNRGYNDTPGFIGNCTRCHAPLHIRDHWTNLFLHKDCFEKNKADIKALQNISNQQNVLKGFGRT